MKISVSIVTYNSRNEIDDVLISLKKSIIGAEIVVYLVDNASSDDTLKYVESNYGDVKIIRANENVGYGAGHNKAIKLIASDYHFIINPDIKFEPYLLQNIIAFLNDNMDVSLAIPKVKGYDDKDNVVPRRYPTLRRLLGSFFGTKTALLKKWRDDYYMVDADVSKPFDIDICSGCFMVFRSTALKLAGGFDERFFLYFEDFDLSRRIKEFGRVVCVPQFTVKHEAQREGHRSSKSFLLLFKSMCKYFNKWGWKI